MVASHDIGDGRSRQSDMKDGKILAVRNTKTIYREGEVCVKLFSNKYSKSYVLREALNHSYIEETGLKIPEIKEVTCIDGEWAIESQCIKGTNLQDLMPDGLRRS